MILMRMLKNACASVHQTAHKQHLLIHLQRVVRVVALMVTMQIIILILVFRCALIFTMNMANGGFVHLLVLLTGLRILRLIELVLETVAVHHFYFSDLQPHQEYVLQLIIVQLTSLEIILPSYVLILVQEI